MRGYTEVPKETILMVEEGLLWAEDPDLDDDCLIGVLVDLLQGERVDLALPFLERLEKVYEQQVETIFRFYRHHGDVPDETK